MKHWVGILALAVSAVLLVGGVIAVQGDGKQGTLERIYWPEENGVPSVSDGQVLPTGAKIQSTVGQGMQDSCIPPSPFAPAPLGSQPC